MFVGHIPRKSWFYVVSWCSNSVAWCWYSYVVLSWSSHLFVDDLSCSCCFLSSFPKSYWSWSDSNNSAGYQTQNRTRVKQPFAHTLTRSRGMQRGIHFPSFNFHVGVYTGACNCNWMYWMNNYCSGPSANLETNWYFRSHSATSCEHLWVMLKHEGSPFGLFTVSWTRWKTWIARRYKIHNYILVYCKKHI